MTDSNRAQLRDFIAAHYEDLFQRLARRLGSRDFAQEALHETFLRLDRFNDPVLVQSPKDYIFRTAINVARNKRRAEHYRTRASDITSLFDALDESPGPARIVEARSEIEALKQALTELPDRRREVVRLIVLEGHSYQDVATHLGISLRTVEADLQQGLQHCADRLKRKLTRRSGGPRLQL